ncbi:MAG TPA: hypothetical protein VFG73_03510 [Rhodanobacteraceae bacterium]|nr:hypothetical protein [Rhodanobacteraceae bacterium]
MRARWFAWRGWMLAALGAAVSGCAQNPRHADAAGFAGGPVSAGTSSASAAAPELASDDQAQAQRLAVALRMVQGGRAAEALEGPIAEVIAHYEQGPGSEPGVRYYCARDQMEALVYLGEAASRHVQALVLSPTWANAYFYRSSALTNLGRIAESQAALRKALALSPWNSLFLAEMGFIYEQQRRFEKSLELFKQAEAAVEFSPESMRQLELAHALRGEGFSLTELHRFDQAEAKYRHALRLNPSDQRSKNELEYIRKKRQEAKGQGGGLDSAAEDSSRAAAKGVAAVFARGRGGAGPAAAH